MLRHVPFHAVLGWIALSAPVQAAPVSFVFDVVLSSAYFKGVEEFRDPETGEVRMLDDEVTIHLDEDGAAVPEDYGLFGLSTIGERTRGYFSYDVGLDGLRLVDCSIGGSDCLSAAYISLPDGYNDIDVYWRTEDVTAALFRFSVGDGYSTRFDFSLSPEWGSAGHEDDFSEDWLMLGGTEYNVTRGYSVNVSFEKVTQLAATPLPASLGFMLTGMGGFLVARRRPLRRLLGSRNPL